MISFRFHLVSIAAVFFALALGVVFGVAAINEATVSTLENRIDKVRADAREANGQLSAWEKFGEDAEDALVAGRLDGVRVFTVVPEGLAGSVTDKMHSVLATAGAVDAGTLVLSDDWADETPRTDELGQVLGIVGPISIDAVLAEAASRLSAEFQAGGGATLPTLVAANLARVDAGDPASAPGDNARFLVIDNGPGAGLLEPLARSMGEVMPNRVLVADAGPDDAVGDSLVGALRKDKDALRVTTVDHIRSVLGRVAAVLGLRDFDRNAVGDYGSDASADRAAPAEG